MSAADTSIVLVIEERHDLRDELAEYLRSLGFIAVPVADTDSASVVVRALFPLDLVIWHGAGPDAAARAAVADWRLRRPQTPILAVLRAPGVNEEGLRISGADVVLHPPIVRAEIERLILQLLRRPERLPPVGA